MLAATVNHAITGWAIVIALLVVLACLGLRQVFPKIEWVTITTLFVVVLTCVGLFAKF